MAIGSELFLVSVDSVQQNIPHHDGFVDILHHDGFVDILHHDGFVDIPHHDGFVDRLFVER